MTAHERNSIMNLADTIKCEINLMCVTKDLAELDSMELHARKNLEKLKKMIYEGDFRYDSGRTDKENNTDPA